MSDYPAGLRLRPIEAWPGPMTSASARQRSPFKAAWRSTLDTLDRELFRLGRQGAASAVLQIAMREQDFRLDGMPRANARPEHPGVILAVDAAAGPLSFPCDTYVTWQENLRALALALEALRRVERYGVTRRAEQYRGWRALPPGGATPMPPAAEPMSARAAAEYLLEHANRTHSGVTAGYLLERRSAVDIAYRLAARQLHPDHGGTTEGFQRLQEARAVLDAHHAGTKS